MPIHGQIEIAGTGLLLLATAWQLFFSTTLSEMVEYARLKGVNRKLDLLDDYLCSHIAMQFDKSLLSTNVPKYSDHTSQWMQAHNFDHSDDPVVRQFGLFEKIRAAIFLVGSVLLLLAKHLEYTAA